SIMTRKAGFVGHFRAEPGRCNMASCAVVPENHVGMCQRSRVVRALTRNDEPDEAHGHQSDRQNSPPARDRIETLEVIQVDALSEFFSGSSAAGHINIGAPSRRAPLLKPTARPITARERVAKRAASDTGGSADSTGAVLRRYSPDHQARR